MRPIFFLLYIYSCNLASATCISVQDSLLKRPIENALVVINTNYGLTDQNGIVCLKAKTSDSIYVFASGFLDRTLSKGNFTCNNDTCIIYLMPILDSLPEIMINETSIFSLLEKAKVNTTSSLSKEKIRLKGSFVSASYKNDTLFTSFSLVSSFDYDFKKDKKIKFDDKRIYVYTLPELVKRYSKKGDIKVTFGGEIISDIKDKLDLFSDTNLSSFFKITDFKSLNSELLEVQIALLSNSGDEFSFTVSINLSDTTVASFHYSLCYNVTKNEKYIPLEKFRTWRFGKYKNKYLPVNTSIETIDLKKNPFVDHYYIVHSIKEYNYFSFGNKDTIEPDIYLQSNTDQFDYLKHHSFFKEFSISPPLDVVPNANSRNYLILRYPILEDILK